MNIIVIDLQRQPKKVTVVVLVDSRAMEAIVRGRSKLTLDAMVDKKLGLENIREQKAPVSNRDQWKTRFI